MKIEKISSGELPFYEIQGLLEEILGYELDALDVKVLIVDDEVDSLNSKFTFSLSDRKVKKYRD